MAFGSHTVSTWVAAARTRVLDLAGARWEGMLLRLLVVPDALGFQLLLRLVRSVAEGVAATEVSIELMTEAGNDLAVAPLVIEQRSHR